MCHRVREAEGMAGEAWPVLDVACWRRGAFIFIQHAKCKQPKILQFARFLAPRVALYVRLCGGCLNWQNNFLNYGNESEADDNDTMAAHNVVAIVATTVTAINDDNDNRQQQWRRGE